MAQLVQTRSTPLFSRPAQHSALSRQHSAPGAPFIDVKGLNAECSVLNAAACGLHIFSIWWKWPVAQKRMVNSVKLYPAWKRTQVEREVVRARTKFMTAPTANRTSSGAQAMASCPP